MEENKPEQPAPKKGGLKAIYENNYKQLLIIPFILLLLAFAQIGYQVATTGDFINKGISLKGGVSVTVQTDQDIDQDALKAALQVHFPENDLNMRTLSGSLGGYIVEADLDITDSASVDNLITQIQVETGQTFDDDQYTVEGIGSSLGESFFLEAGIAMIVAFLFMGLVVFIYFRALAPSAAVILAAFSDIVVTIAVINILGMKMSTSSIVGLLLLIGYSVDTDILLSTRVLRRKEGSIMERIYDAMKTGMTMTCTTIVAVLIALMFTQSDIIAQIMTILLIGLVIDVINTYIQNVGLLRLHLERKK